VPHGAPLAIAFAQSQAAASALEEIFAGAYSEAS